MKKYWWKNKDREEILRHLLQLKPKVDLFTTTEITKKQANDLDSFIHKKFAKLEKSMSGEELASLLDKACEEYYGIMIYNMTFDAAWLKDKAPGLSAMLNTLELKGQSPNFVNRVAQFTQTLTKLDINTSKDIKTFLPTLAYILPAYLNIVLDKGLKQTEVINEYFSRTDTTSIFEEVLSDRNYITQNSNKSKTIEEALDEKIKE